MNTQTIELDVDKRGCGNNCIKIAQGEAGGTTIQGLIYDNGTELALTGYTACLVVRLPDRAHYYKGTATVSGNAVTYVCDEDKLASVGGYTDEAYFEFTKGSQTVQTERFALDIMRDARDGLSPAASWDNTIEELMQRGEAAVVNSETAVKNANSAVTTANSASSKANTAASAANTAASKATTAANSASTATDTASAAADAANTAASKANTAATSASEATDTANSAAADARKAAEEARGAVSPDMKIYFKRVTDAQGNSRPVLVDMTV